MEIMRGGHILDMFQKQRSQDLLADGMWAQRKRRAKDHTKGFSLHVEKDRFAIKPDGEYRE